MVQLASSDAVVIVGSGFGGLTAALELSRQTPRPPITVVDPRDRFLFQPLLYELLSEELQAWEVAPRLEHLLISKGINWVRARVVSIDTAAKTAVTSSGDSISWAQMLIATGSSSHDFGIPGVRQHAMGFQTFEDVSRLRQRVRDLQLQRSDTSSLVIVGGGPTGVELACKLADLLQGAARLHLVEMGETILANSSAFNREKALAALERRDVCMHLNTAVTAVLEAQVRLNSGDTLHHDGLIWTAGNRAHPPKLEPSPTPSSQRLPIDPQLRLETNRDVFAIGDASCCPSESWPCTAQVAMQQGESVAKAIQATRAGDDPPAFRFQDRGEMLSLGIGEATLTGMGITLAGPLAFQLRRATYLTRLPGVSLGLRAAGSWLLDR